MNKNKKHITEGLENGDLKGMVSSIISIDHYKPKTGTDEEAVVVVFFLKDSNPAKDLVSFIHMSEIDLLDVEASTSIDDDGNYHVYVEFERTSGLFNSLMVLLNSVDKVTSDKGDWKFIPFKSKEEYPVNKENFKSMVIDDKNEYIQTYGKNKTPEETIKERIQFMVNY